LNLGPPEYEAEVLRHPSRRPVNAKAFLVLTRSVYVRYSELTGVIFIIFMLIKFSISLEQKLPIRTAPPITHVQLLT
jgi:hypothetical protein